MSHPASALGIIVTVGPHDPEFSNFLSVAADHLNEGKKVYAYLLHDAVEGISHPVLQSLTAQGLVLHACALAASLRDVPNSDLAVFSGLVTLGEILQHCDPVLTFSPETTS